METPESKKREIQQLKDLYGERHVDLAGFLIIPEDVVDKSAYKDYLKTIKEYEELKTDAIVVTSNVEVTVNLALPTNHIIKAIVDLPEEEKEDLIRRNKRILRLRGQSLALNNKAYKRNVERSEKVWDVMLRRRFELINYFSRYYSNEEVWKITNYEWKIRATRSQVKAFRTKYSVEIRNGQDEYRNSLNEVRLTYKRSRMDELLELYNDRRDLYYNGKRSANDHRLLLATLEQIRKEVEGERVTVDASLQISIEKSISLHQEEIMREIPIKTMIISMTAGRMGINPLWLLTRLTQSYYSQFTGIGGPTLAYDKEEITFPSQFIFNLDELRVKSAEKLKSEEELTKYEDLSDDEASRMGVIKENLLKKLQAKKKVLEEVKKKMEVQNQIREEEGPKQIGKPRK